MTQIELLCTLRHLDRGFKSWKTLEENPADEIGCKHLDNIFTRPIGLEPDLERTYVLRLVWHTPLQLRRATWTPRSPTEKPPRNSSFVVLTFSRTFHQLDQMRLPNPVDVIP